MNCNCIEDFKKKTLETQLLKEKGKIITDVSLPVLWSFNNNGMTERLKIVAELEIEGRKTPHKIDVAYAYCPFCGKSAHEKEEINEQDS